jgi:hypothetical protein
MFSRREIHCAAAALVAFVLLGVHQSAHAQDLKPTLLTVEQATEIVAGKSAVSLDGVTELGVDVAQVLSQYGKGDLRLHRVQTITPEVARALAPEKKGGTLWLGLKTITPEVATALAAHSRGMLALNALDKISVEVARELAQFRGKLTLNGLRTLSPEVARELAKHRSKFTLFGLMEISDEAAEALADHRGTLLLNGLTKLTSVPLITKMLKADDGFLSLAKVQTISDHVAKFLAEHQGKRSIRLTGLTTLSEANATLLRGNQHIELPSQFQKSQNRCSPAGVVKCLGILNGPPFTTRNESFS